eukprot:TRINITY_DN6297_c0_g2_i1.p1 TRINITY_DN6297_c0_g2~~TRINITY_DN6297_c0_g2_i1.p1  ORF type:complete len:655 (-),score=131.08 TRINITY_DN6297_c0_g2_i1:90-1997(-)
MKAPTDMNAYGSEFTRDVFALCDAHQVAHDGDAHFFTLESVVVTDDHSSVASATDGRMFVSFDGYCFLKDAGAKQKRNLEYVIAAGGQNVAALWLPAYFTAEHFARAFLLAPDVLGRLLQHDRLSYTEEMVGVLHTIWGMSILNRRDVMKEIDWVMLLHKLRSLWEFGERFVLSNGQTLNARQAGWLVQKENDGDDGNDRNISRVVGSAFIVPPDTISWENLFQRNARTILTQSLNRFTRDKPNATTLLWRALLGFSRSKSVKDAKEEEEEEEEEGRSVLEMLKENAAVVHYTEEKLDLLKEADFDEEQATAVIDLVLCETDGDDDAPRELRLSDLAKFTDVLGKWHSLLSAHGSFTGVFDTLDALFLDDKDASVAQDNYKKLLHDLTSATSAYSTFTPLSTRTIAAVMLQSLLSMHYYADIFGNTDEFLKEARAVALEKEVAFRKQQTEKQTKQQKIIQGRKEQAKFHPIQAELPQSRGFMGCSCVCGEYLGGDHYFRVWGQTAKVDNAVLHKQARREVLKTTSMAMENVITIDSLTEKRYKELGGTYSWPSESDTFIQGLHARTKALRIEWSQAGKDLSEDAAVDEMLLRLRWDTRLHKTKPRLENIIRFLWNAYTHKGPKKSNIPSSIRYDF